MSLSRSLDGARKAFHKKDAYASRKAHDANMRSSAPEQHKTAGNYIKSAVYGGLDGIITTFAVVAGVAGASLSSGVVLILGFANLIADGISMAVGDYLSTKAEQEYQKREREREEWEFDNYPEGEHKEMVELFEDRGLTHKESKQVIDIMAQHRRTFIDFMMVEELGILEDDENPVKNALVTLGSFLLFGFVPLITFVFSPLVPFFRNHSFPVASVLTGLTLFGLGALKFKFTSRAWWKLGLEMLLVGGIAAAAAFGIGHLLSGFA
ncbi:MAG: VIT1/CCC1 transporter family protein [Nanoarchaeota archaeon]